jgi:hypothetical protein
MTTFFQNYLDLGLFPVEDSDTRLENLQSAVADLVGELNDDNSLLPSYTLVALDSSITTDPALDHVEGLIKQHWRQIRVKFPEQPVMIIRGVILAALDELGRKDVAAARIIYLSAVDSISFFQQGKESGLIQNLVSELGYLAEEDATDEWALKEEEPNLKLPTLKAVGFATSNLEYKDNGALSEALKNALGPTSNGYYQNHDPETWNAQFASKASAAIAQSLSSLATSMAQNLSPKELQASISKFFSEFKHSLDETLKGAFSSLTAIERRSKLLWWKEAMYSATLTKSYHQLDALLQPVIAAVDLNNLVPEICPISVDFLLQDALRLMDSREQQESLSVKAIIEALMKSQYHDLLKEYLVPRETSLKRISLPEFIALILHGNITLAELTERTGINEEQALSLGDFAVFAFHHFLLGRLISTDE